MLEELLTPREAAKILKVSQHTIYRLVGFNKLRSYKFGDKRQSRIRIRREDLDAFIEDQKREAGNETSLSGRL